MANPGLGVRSVGPVCDFLEQSVRFFSILSVDSSCITSRGAGDQAASTIGGGKLATDTWHP